MRNELVFREVNDRIFGIAEQGNVGDELEILCECGDESCITSVRVRIRDYERVRLEASHFIVCDGHVRDEIERVIERSPEFLVVEKIGQAGRSRSAGTRPRPTPSR